MEKLSNNELLSCLGGNIITTFTGLFISMINITKKIKLIFGGRK